MDERSPGFGGLLNGLRGLARALLGALIAAQLACGNSLATIVDIEDGDIVEGSVSNGGAQPDYLIDLDNRRWKPLFAACDRIRESALPFWEKIERVVDLVNDQVFEGGHYYDQRYLRLMHKHRKPGGVIPLSKYLHCKAGVCREHALVTHLLLKRAGIENRYSYARVQVWFHDRKIKEEDHAFVIALHEDDRWIVDAYNDDFNGFRLDEAMSVQGLTSSSAGSAISKNSRLIRKILHFQPFPKVYSRQGELCQDLLVPGLRPDLSGAISRSAVR
jgi:hypothetical protein